MPPAHRMATKATRRNYMISLEDMNIHSGIVFAFLWARDPKLRSENIVWQSSDLKPNVKKLEQSPNMFRVETQSREVRTIIEHVQS
jgi:hypothetical protein